MQEKFLQEQLKLVFSTLDDIRDWFSLLTRAILLLLGLTGIFTILVFIFAASFALDYIVPYYPELTNHLFIINIFIKLFGYVFFGTTSVLLYRRTKSLTLYKDLINRLTDEKEDLLKKQYWVCESCDAKISIGELNDVKNGMPISAFTDLCKLYDENTCLYQWAKSQKGK